VRVPRHLQDISPFLQVMVGEECRLSLYFFYESSTEVIFVVGSLVLLFVVAKEWSVAGLSGDATSIMLFSMGTGRLESGGSAGLWGSSAGRAG